MLARQDLSAGSCGGSGFLRVRRVEDVLDEFGGRALLHFDHVRVGGVRFGMPACFAASVGALRKVFGIQKSTSKSRSIQAGPASSRHFSFAI